MTETDFLHDVLLGDIGAVEFCCILGRASQVLDDLVDGDRVTGQDIVEVFWKLIAELPANPFFATNREQLIPAIKIAFLDWIAANDLEQGSDHDRHLSFVLRDRLTSVVVLCAEIVGGFQYAAESAAEIQRFFQAEPFETYAGDFE